MEIQIHFQCHLIMTINNLHDPRTPRHKGYNSIETLSAAPRPGGVIEPIPSSRKTGDQPQRDHGGADLSIAALILNPSLQSALSGLIGVPLHRLREINSGSTLSPPHQKSCGLAPAPVVIIGLLCLFRETKETWTSGGPEHHLIPLFFTCALFEHGFRRQKRRPLVNFVEEPGLISSQGDASSRF